MNHLTQFTDSFRELHSGEEAKWQHSNLKHEAYPEVPTTAIHRKSARGQSQKGANVHIPHVKISVFTAKIYVFTGWSHGLLL